MKLSRLFLLTFIGVAHTLQMQGTDVPGGNVSGIWTAAGSPYNIMGNIRVPVGESLLIEAGAEVIFNGPYLLRILGDFEANGAPGDSVSFSWTGGNSFNKGIRLDSLSLESDTIRFDHCRISSMQNGKIQLINANKVVFENSRIFNNVGHIPGALSIFASNGVMIRDCYFHNNSTGSQTYGGAVYIHDSSPLLENNRFRANTATYSGGAVSMWRFNSPTTPVLRNNIFEANSAASAGAIDIRTNVVPLLENNQFIGNIGTVTGGAIWIGYVQAGTATFVNNLFQGNYANQRGGAIYGVESKLSIIGDRYIDNYTNSISGGAMYLYDNFDLDLVDCEFTGNSASQGGALLVESTATVDIDRCKFANNSAGLGAVFTFSSNVTGTVSNSLFVNNSTTNVGGVMRLTQFSDMVFLNCTFAHNSTDANGSVASLYWDSDPTFANCIFYGNTAASGATIQVQDYITNYCNPSFDHCLMQGGFSALALGSSSLEEWTEVIDTDPLFVAPSGGSGDAFQGLDADWRIAEDLSPCLDAGIYEGYSIPDPDLNGDQRVQGEAIDLGCYEGGAPLIPFPEEIDFNGDGQISMGDLLIFFAEYGCSQNCDTDLNGDGVVNSADLILILGLWP